MRRKAPGSVVVLGCATGPVQIGTGEISSKAGVFSIP